MKLTNCILDQVLAFIAVTCMVIQLRLYFIHFKIDKRSLKNKVKSKKSFCLLTLILMNCIIFSQKFFFIRNNLANRTLELIIGTLQSLGTFGIIYFVFRKASKLLKDSKKWIKISTVVFLLGQVIMLLLTLWLLIQFIGLEKNKINAQSDANKEIDKQKSLTEK